jgi:hypothetical protein
MSMFIRFCQTTLEIAGQRYDLSFDVNQPLEQVAHDFCVLHEREWQLSIDTINSHCVQPVQLRLKDIVQS